MGSEPVLSGHTKGGVGKDGIFGGNMSLDFAGILFVGGLFALFIYLQNHQNDTSEDEDAEDLEYPTPTDPIVKEAMASFEDARGEHGLAGTYRSKF